MVATPLIILEVLDKMLPCIKRQKMVIKGEEHLRCIEASSEHKGEEVNADICAACPVRKFRKERPCKKKHKQETSPPPEYPAVSAQAWLYKEALSRWVKAGRPTRTQAEVDSIIENHCTQCDWYDKEKKRCRGCGCKVTNSSIAIVNKVKMGTESCPKGLW